MASLGDGDPRGDEDGGLPPADLGEAGMHAGVHLLDPVVIAGLRAEVGSDVVDELRVAFLDQLDDSLRAMDAALDGEDGDALAAAAHRLKGGASALGAKAIADGAAELERISHHGDLEAAAELLVALRSDIDQTRTVLGREGSARASAPLVGDGTGAGPA